MRIILLLATRYLFSKKSNNIINLISWISLIAISFTTATFIIIISIMNGFTGVVSDLYNSVEPDLKITPAVGKYFKADLILKNISQHNNVKCVSKSLSNQSLIKYQGKQILVSVKGVDSIFNKVTSVSSIVRDGKWILRDKDLYYVIVGQGVANQLDLNINNQFKPIVFYSPKRVKNTGMSIDVINEKLAYVSGIFSLNDDLDYKYIFCDLNFAQQLFDVEDLVSSLEIALIKKERMEHTQIELQNILGNNFIVKNRQQLNEVLFKTLQTEKLWTFIILSFILIIATFSIISALTMLVIEKQKDIQTLYALGANKQMIESIFMAEGFLITFGGAFIGLILGILVCWVQIEFHLITFNENSILPYYPVELEAGDIFMVMAVLLVIGFWAAIYPVRLFTKQVRWRAGH